MGSVICLRGPTVSCDPYLSCPADQKPLTGERDRRGCISKFSFQICAGFVGGQRRWRTSGQPVVWISPVVRPALSALVHIRCLQCTVSTRKPRFCSKGSALRPKNDFCKKLSSSKTTSPRGINSAYFYK